MKKKKNANLSDYYKLTLGCILKLKFAAKT
jgi:hypothetical protein